MSKPAAVLMLLAGALAAGGAVIHGRATAGPGGGHLAEAVIGKAPAGPPGDNGAAAGGIRTIPDVFASLKADLVRMPDYPQLAGAAEAEVGERGFVYVHHCRPLAKGGYEDTGPNAVAIGFEVVPWRESREGAQRVPGQPLPYTWPALGIAGWTTLHLGPDAVPDLSSKLKDVLSKHVALMDQLDRRVAARAPAPTAAELAFGLWPEGTFRDGRDHVKIAVRNQGPRTIPGAESKQVLMDGALYLIRPDGSSVTKSLGGWRGKAPPDVARGESASHCINTAVDELFPFEEPGRYRLWWTSGGRQSNVLVFEKGAEGLRLVSGRPEAGLRRAADGASLQTLTGVLRERVKSASPYDLELDGASGTIALRGEVLRRFNPGTRLRVRGVVRTGLHNPPPDGTPQQQPVHWEIWMDVVEAEEIASPFGIQPIGGFMLHGFKVGGDGARRKQGTPPGARG